MDGSIAGYGEPIDAVARCGLEELDAVGFDAIRRAAHDGSTSRCWDHNIADRGLWQGRPGTVVVFVEASIATTSPLSVTA